MELKDAEKRMIFKFLSGSHAYGFATPDSDFDYRGVFIAPSNYLLGLQNVEQIEKIGEKDDVVFFEIRKFFRLLKDCNPNIVEFVFAPADCIEYVHPLWEKIVENRSLFLSTKVRWTFVGYAMAQAKRIKTHRGYIMNPPSHKPTRDEFGLPEASTVPREHRSAILSIPVEYLDKKIQDNARNEIRFQDALKKWNAYQEWDNRRNPKRKALEKKYRYDVKHACHLVRLSKMGEELLLTGSMNVRRPDADELAAIKNGEWSYEKLEKYIENIDTKFNVLYQKSTLPKKPDLDGIKNLLGEILESYYGWEPLFDR